MTYKYDEESGRYVVRGARILFPNFAGVEQEYNAAGKRNFRLQLDEDLANEMRDRGVHVREREGRDETEETQYLMKIGIYSDADVRLLSGKAMTKVLIENNENGLPTRNDQGELVDAEFRKGHVMNGKIDLEFHISKNTRVSSSSPYARVDTVIVPIRKSRLLEEYEDYGDDELPM